MTLDLLTTKPKPPKCPLFVELCAGTAALSLALQAGARPPISRMGAKTGYADAILGALGLRKGDGAACYLWCEPDDGARALLMSYALPELRKEAADIILSWKDEDPRALWERLRAEGPVRGVNGREVARWLWTWGRSFNTKGPDAGFLPSRSSNGVEVWNAHPPEWFADRLTSLPPQPPTATTPDARAIDPREVARVMRLLTANRLINLDPQTWSNTGQGGTTHGGVEFCTDPERLAAAAEAVPDEWPEVVICADGAMVDAREVARWVTQEGWTNSGRYMGPDRPSSCHSAGWTASITRDGMARRLSSLPTPWPPTVIQADARTLQPVSPPYRLPPGTVVFADPPYENTTGYAHDLPRSEVLRIARRWADAGATVVISEAVPLGSIVHEGIADAEPGPLEGWHCYEITQTRIGQKRTFSKQKREWITMSQPADKAWAAGLALTNRGARNRAAAKPAVQPSLFGSES